MAYNIINLEDICNSMNKDEVKKIISNFECNLNKDVETFFKDKAVEFCKQGIAKTFIITSSFQEKQVIVGYFAIATKTIEVKRNALNSKTRKRLSKFAVNDPLSSVFEVPLPLIGQIGKNYKNGYDKLISGDVLLKIACKKVKEAQKIVGGRFAYLECEDKEKLKEFYESNGFVCFGKRNLDRDERKNNAGEYLLQMLRDLSNLDD